MVYVRGSLQRRDHPREGAVPSLEYKNCTGQLRLNNINNTKSKTLYTLFV